MEGLPGALEGLSAFLKGIFRLPKSRFSPWDNWNMEDNCTATDFILRSVKLAKGIKLSITINFGLGQSLPSADDAISFQFSRKSLRKRSISASVMPVARQYPTALAW